MELATTKRFASAHAWYRRALDAFNRDCDIDDLNAPANSALSDNYENALSKLLLIPARTAEAVRQKLSILHAENIWLRNGLPDVLAALDRDLLDLRRPAPTLHEPFAKWRAAYLAYVDASDRDDGEATLSELSEASAEALRALLATPCISPGDMLVKIYVDALDGVGRAEAGQWDIAIEDVDHSYYLHDDWQRSAYRDLDMCDLGACLLVFGEFDFSARAWIDRALDLNVALRVDIDPTGEASLRIGEHQPDANERRQRERARLQRLIAFDPARASAVIAAIHRDWPRLISHQANAA